MSKNKIAVILGTRPEIIKLSSIVRELENLKNNNNNNNNNNDLEYFIIHTNQHYSKNMDEVFFKDLNLPTPKYNLNIGSKYKGKQLSKMIAEISKILEKENPNISIVQGDTNSVLAGAIASSKLNIKIAHIEAGLRSYDLSMPEEVNRTITDNLSYYLFPPTELSKNNLLEENINKNIFVVGNTIVDATIQNIKIAEKKIKNIIQNIDISKDYFLLTIHRAENTDKKEKLEKIVNGIISVVNKFNINTIFPIHPRTENKLKEYNLYNKLKNNKYINIIEPVGYLEFLMLEKNAKLILTDSGGVQEEACILKIPCITLRENTERPETLNNNCNVLVGTDENKLLIEIEKRLNNKINIKWENPFGDGNSGKRIINILLNKN